jgi:hypothetical protein
VKITTNHTTELKMSESLLTDETRLHIAPTGHKYRIQFHLDSDCGTPWEYEGSLPMIWLSDRSFDNRGSRGFDLLNPLPFLSDRKIRANLEKLAKLAEYDGAAELDRDARRYYHDSPIAEGRRLSLSDTWLGDGEKSERRLREIAELWQLAGIPAQVIISRGYSQGDWAALLIVAHPEAVKAFGFKTMAAYKKACPDDLESAANTWGAWCWGGVVGYVVERIDPDEYEDGDDLNQLRNCENVDSCWGFYPEHDQVYFPLEKNHAYALGQAIEAADNDAAKLAKQEAAARDLESTVDAAAMIEARPDMYGAAPC